MSEEELDWNKYLGLFESKLEAIDQASIIVSSEYLVGPMLNPKSLALKKTRFLSQSFDDITIVFYVRRQDTMYESIFQQQHKNAEIDSFEAFQKKYDPRVLSYMQRLERIEKLFPNAHIVVRPYEFTISKVDILRDFLNSVGIGDVPEKIRSPYSNLGFSDVGLYVLNICARHLGKDENRRIRNLLTSTYRQTLPINKKNYRYLSDEDRRRIIRFHSEGNREIFRRYSVGSEDDFLAWESFGDEQQEGGNNEMNEEGVAERSVAFLVKALIRADSQSSLE